MRFYTTPHRYYCGIDLHARQMWVLRQTTAPPTAFAPSSRFTSASATASTAPASTAPTRPYFPGLLAARADQFVLEFAGRELSELDLWKEYGGDRELGAGGIDVKGFYLESAEDVARRIHRVLTVCKAEKLYVNPNCGFGWSPRYM